LDGLQRTTRLLTGSEQAERSGVHTRDLIDRRGRCCADPHTREPEFAYERERLVSLGAVENDRAPIERLRILMESPSIGGARRPDDLGTRPHAGYAIGRTGSRSRVTEIAYKSMAYSHGASALGVAVAMSEIVGPVAEEAVLADWSLASGVASASAGSCGPTLPAWAWQQLVAIWVRPVAVPSSRKGSP
jgi:Amidohydrolase ring-opening protein (Amido_AtzD_TrzD)